MVRAVSGRARAGRIAQAAILSSFALAGAAWAGLNIASSLDEARLVGLVTRIAEGDRFKAETLADLEPVMRRVSEAPAPKPTLLRAVALIRLRQFELEIAASRPTANNEKVAATEHAIRRALSYTPTDGFLWYALAWTMKYRDGSSPAVIRALAMSYDTAAHEGWVSIHRNGFALSLYGDLPPPLQAKVVTEYRDLVASNYLSQAADILTGPGWAQRDLLLPALESVPEWKRYDLYRAFLDRGHDIPVPGVDRHPDRPWKSP